MLAETLTYLRAAYPRATFPPETIAVYVQELRDLPDEELVAACRRLGRRNMYLPTIAEIRREVVETRLALPTAGEAWQSALDVVDGRTTLAELPRVVQDAYRAAGGRWAFKTSTNPGALRHQFERDYDRRVEALMRATVTADGCALALPPARREELPPAGSDADLLWAAGFLEGEGSFIVGKGYPVVKATQVQRDPLERLMRLYGGSLQNDKRERDGHQEQTQWSLWGDPARSLMWRLHPHMSPRRQEQIREVVGEPHPELAGERDALASEWLGADLPSTPVERRMARRFLGHDLAVPTDEERRDAIRVLREGTGAPDPKGDAIYCEAERIFEEASRA